MEEEFEEEEVWAVVRESHDDSLNGRKIKDASFFSSTKACSASRKIPRSNTAGEASSSAPLLQQSAPVTIPSWCKIFEKGENGHEDDEEDDEEEERVPPHEWIARRMERSENFCFSVCEGEGRTHKGRDQRKLRNAILTSTGFLE